jgi:FtsH-binding integral membrane protein
MKEKEWAYRSFLTRMAIFIGITIAVALYVKASGNDTLAISTIGACLFCLISEFVDYVVPKKFVDIVVPKKMK